MWDLKLSVLDHCLSFYFPVCLYRLCIMHLLATVIFNEKINIKITKLLFLWFFATIKILKILKLGTP